MPLIGMPGLVGKVSRRGSPYQLRAGYLDPRFLVSRTQAGGALSTGLSAGAVVQYYPANTARFVGTKQRLLIEGPFTAQTLSSNFTGAVLTGWTNDNFVNPYQDQGLGPDGLSLTTRMDESTGPIQHTIRQNITVGAGADALVTAFLFAPSIGPRRYVNLNIFNTAANVAGVQIDTVNWTIVTYQLGTGLVRSARISPVSAGHYLVQLVGAIPAQTSYDINICPVPNAGDYTTAINTFGSNYGVWALSAGQSPVYSSFIPTTTVAQTRGIDLIYSNGANFASLCPAGNMTVLLSGLFLSTAPTDRQTVFFTGSGDGTFDYLLIHRVPASTTFRVLLVQGNGATVSQFDLGTVADNTYFRLAFTLTVAGRLAASLNGGAVQTGTVPWVGQVQVCSLGVNYRSASAAESMIGEMERMALLPSLAADAALPALCNSIP